jgi:hypothetical protein
MGAARCVVVDTNVLAIAEGMHAEAGQECVDACRSLVRQVDRGLLLVLDANGEILQEYVSRMRAARTAGLPVKLVKRLLRTHHDPSVCKKVPITPHHDPPGSYLEVPPPLRDFDVDDQKFLAVAISEGSRPLVYAGLDREWWGRQRDLAERGLNVQFPCFSDLMDIEGDASAS